MMRSVKFKMMAHEHPIVERLVHQLIGPSRGSGSISEFLKQIEQVVTAIRVVKFLPWEKLDLNQSSRHSRLNTLSGDPAVVQSIRYMVYGELGLLDEMSGHQTSSNDFFLELPGGHPATDGFDNQHWADYQIINPKMLMDLDRCWKKESLVGNMSVFKASHVVELVTLSSPAYGVLGYWVKVFAIPS